MLNIQFLCVTNLRLRQRIRRKKPFLLEKFSFWINVSFLIWLKFSHWISSTIFFASKICALKTLSQILLDLIELDQTHETIHSHLLKSINCAVLLVVNPSPPIQNSFTYFGINGTHCLHIAILFKWNRFGTVFKMRFIERKMWKNVWLAFFP